MKIKDLKTENKNLFDYIPYFEKLDTKIYWVEFGTKYGNFKIYPDMEQVIEELGLEEIGLIFSLRSKDWENLENISNSINTPLSDLEKIIETKETTRTGKDDTTRTGTDTTDNKYESFDGVEVDTDNTLKDNAENVTTNTDDNENYTLTRTKTGYSENYYNFVKEIFENSIPYRFRIYADIVNVLALQIY